MRRANEKLKVLFVDPLVLFLEMKIPEIGRYFHSTLNIFGHPLMDALILHDYHFLLTEGDWGNFFDEISPMVLVDFV